MLALIKTSTAISNSLLVNLPSNPNLKSLAEQQREEMQEFIAQLQGEAMDRYARTHYCVMNSTRTTLVKDPGMARPLALANKKQAELVAKQVGGVVETLHNALRYLLNNANKSLKKTGGN